MSDTMILLKGALKVIKYFFPVIIFIVTGLTYIAYDERRGERGQRFKKNKRRAPTS